MAHHRSGDDDEKPRRFTRQAARPAFELEQRMVFELRRLAKEAFHAGRIDPTDTEAVKAAGDTVARLLREMEHDLDSLRMLSSQESRIELRHRVVAEFRQLLERGAQERYSAHIWQQEVRERLTFLESLTPTR